MKKWLYNGKEFTSEMINSYYGFIYNITNNINGKQYIGRKYFFSKRRLKPLAGKKRHRIKITESDWKKYNSSSKYLLADIERFGEINFKFEILSLHNNKAETNFAELKTQIYLNVLEELDEYGNRKFINENIERKYYHNEKENDNRLKLTESLVRINNP